MRDLVILLAWIIMIPAAYFRPFVGVLLWTWTAFLSPNGYAYGFLTGVPFNKVVAVATMVMLAFAPGPKKIFWNSTLICLFILMGHGTVSYLLAGDNYGAPPIFDRFWKECLLCLFIIITITNRLRFHAMLGISAFAITFPGVVEGLKVIASGGAHHIPGIASFGDNNQGALALLMILPVLNYLARQSEIKIIKNIYLISMGLVCVAVVGTWSRGGFLGLGVLAIAFILLARNKFRSLAIVCAIASIIMFFASAQYYQRLETIQSADADTSFMGRVLAWKVSFAIATENPVFGVGFHGLQDGRIYVKYLKKVTIPTILIGGGDYDVKAAHSIYFEVMGDLGFVGLGIFLSLLIIGFVNTRKLTKWSKNDKDLTWVYEAGVMFRLILIEYCTAGAGVSMAYFEMNFVMLTLLSILVRLCEEMGLSALGFRGQYATSPSSMVVDTVGRPIGANMNQVRPTI